MSEGFQGADAYNVTGQDHDWAAGDTKAANNPTALTGYDPEVAPDPNWPGLSADPKQVRFDAMTVEGLLAQVEGMIPMLRQQVSRLRGEVTGAQFGPAVWPQAENLRAANQTVAEGVGTFTGNVVLSLENAVGAIQSALETYHQKEAEIQGGISRTSGNLNS
jgi:hypothetical protein